MLNTFSNNSAFSMASMTEAINLLPNKPSRLGELNLFVNKPISTRHLFIDERQGKLNLLMTKPLGSPGQKADRPDRTARYLKVPHIPYDDTLLAEDIYGIREFGTQNQPIKMIDYITECLQNMKNKHEVTLERLRMGALRGIILDANDMVIYNLYEEFLIKQKKVDFLLGSSTSDIRAKCLEAKRWIETHVSGAEFTEVRCICGPTFFDRLTGHPMVIDAYDRWMQGHALRADMRKEFNFGGIVFEEYGPTNVLPDADGTARTFMPASEAVAVPIGLNNGYFQTILAPGDFNETVNIPGKLLYAKLEELPYKRGVKIHTQSNPLPICNNPDVLVALHSSN